MLNRRNRKSQHFSHSSKNAEPQARKKSALQLYRQNAEPQEQKKSAFQPFLKNAEPAGSEKVSTTAVIVKTLNHRNRKSQHKQPYGSNADLIAIIKYKFRFFIHRRRSYSAVRST